VANTTLTVVDHPLIVHKMSFVSDRPTGAVHMRLLVEEISLLMTFAATGHLKGEEVTFHTPLEQTRARRVRLDRLVVVPILRAGLGMVEGVLRLIPEARVGHLGFYRNEKTLQPVRYYGKTPSDPESLRFLLVDPMLGTGGTAVASVDYLKARGARDISLMCLIAAPEGAGRLSRAHPDVSVYAAALDRRLDERGYVLPGMGDAGDRLFGTW